MCIFYYQHPPSLLYITPTLLTPKVMNNDFHLHHETIYQSLSSQSLFHVCWKCQSLLGATAAVRNVSEDELKICVLVTELKGGLLVEYYRIVQNGIFSQYICCHVLSILNQISIKIFCYKIFIVYNDLYFRSPCARNDNQDATLPMPISLELPPNNKSAWLQYGNICTMMSRMKVTTSCNQYHTPQSSLTMLNSTRD